MMAMKKSLSFKAKNEADATSKYLKELRQIPNSWWYKIPDIGKKIKPLDIIWQISWKFICIEVKYIKKSKKHIWSYDEIYNGLEVHQLATLEINARAWGSSYIAWYFESFNKLIIFPWQNLQS